MHKGGSAWQARFKGEDRRNGRGGNEGVCFYDGKPVRELQGWGGTRSFDMRPLGVAMRRSTCPDGGATSFETATMFARGWPVDSFTRERATSATWAQRAVFGQMMSAVWGLGRGGANVRRLCESLLETMCNQ